MYKFQYNENSYYIDFISSYQGNKDYLLQYGSYQTRISSNRDYPKFGLERRALAEYLKQSHNKFRVWAKDNDFKTVGHAMAWLNS